MADKEILYDIDGYDIITNALLDLINQYPAINEKFSFSSLVGDSGVTMYPTSGAVIQRSFTDVTGYTEQKCVYPFALVYRASGISSKNKIKIKEWLDNLGRWLEKQPVVINGEDQQLTEYPPLTHGRSIESITRTSPAYQTEESESKTEDWAINVEAVYTNRFKKI